jgi:hypothetical protein
MISYDFGIFNLQRNGLVLHWNFEMQMAKAGFFFFFVFVFFFYKFGQRHGVGETPKIFSVTKGQSVVKDQIIIQKNSEYLNCQRWPKKFA